MILCQFENGNKASLRHTVVDMLVVKDNQILLVKRAPHMPSGNKYCVVGGFVERDETTQEAAMREIIEETGYKSEIQHLFRIIDNPKRKGEDRQNVSFVYIVKPLEKVGGSDHEVKETQWFDLDKLPSEEEFAFDHYDIIQSYLDHLQNPLTLPTIG